LSATRDPSIFERFRAYHAPGRFETERRVSPRNACSPRPAVVE
jgi:hypothetical protein